MKVLYIADDGTKFENEEECRVYEHLGEFRGKDRIIAGLDEHGNIMKFSKDEDFCECVMVVGLDNEEAVELFKNRCEYEGFNCMGIHEPGIYIWADFINDSDYGKWLSVDSLIEKHQSVINKIQGYKKKISFE